MDDDAGTIPVDFLRELDFWLLEGGVASPALSRPDALPSGGNGVASGSIATVFSSPSLPTQQRKADEPHRSATLTVDTQRWTSTTPSFTAENDSAASPRPAERRPTRRAATTASGSPSSASSAGTGGTRRPSAASRVDALASEPARKRTKPNKSTSQRQKEELAYLRSKTQQLEATLTTLKQQNREELERQQQEKVQNGEMDAGGATSTDLVVKSACGSAFSGQREVSLWERIAKRQREEKAKAEVENAKLREMVQSQLRLVKSFERLLRKRRVWDQLQDDKWHRSVTEGRKEDEVFDDMLRAVDARYPHADAILEEHGLEDSGPAVNMGDDANMKYSAVDGMYLEFKEKKFMPFDYNSMDAVVWRSFAEGKLKLEDSAMTIVKRTEDVVFSKCILPPTRRAAGSSDSKESGSLVMLSVMKRFQEERRMVYVWFSTMSVDRTEEGDGPPVHLIQKGCSTMAPATLTDGSPGCVVKSYASSVPTLSGEVGEDPELQQAQHREVGILTEMIFAAYQQSRQNINQTLENLLLDEMMAKNTSSATETESSTETGSSER